MSKWDNLAAWWADGVPIVVIAKRVGASHSAVWAAAARQGLRRPRKTMWNEENITELRMLWLDGVRTQLIAERLSATRAAVIGKAARIGLPTHALAKAGGRG
jgi:hypothetical protein